jgi:alpha-glucosidase
MTLWVWRGTGEFTLYEDDGRSFDYKTGAYCLTTYQLQARISPQLINISLVLSTEPTTTTLVNRLLGGGFTFFSNSLGVLVKILLVLV